ncbi:MAG: hypothetical protein LBQ66_07095 [Planctomycetaceae bacterium]|nr:hypothetical protein [Planctomycetaceae bacterium]
MWYNKGGTPALSALGNQTSLEGTPKRVGEHLPNRFGVPFKLFWCYYTQRRAGRPRSSPRRFAAKLMWYNEGGTPAFQSAAASRRNLCGITRARCPRSSPRRFAANLCGITRGQAPFANGFFV